MLFLSLIIIFLYDLRPSFLFLAPFATQTYLLSLSSLHIRKQMYYLFVIHSHLPFMTRTHVLYLVLPYLPLRHQESLSPLPQMLSSLAQVPACILSPLSFCHIWLNDPQVSTAVCPVSKKYRVCLCDPQATLFNMNHVI